MYKNKKLVISLSLLLTALLILSFLVWTNKISLPWENNQSKTTQSDGINYNPPTEQEKKETEEFKSDQVSKDQDSLNTTKPTSTDQSTGLKNVDVIMTSWGQNKSTKDIEASGLVNTTPENGGTCTLVAEKDGKTITGTSQGVANAQNVSCGTAKLASSELSPGQWTLRIDYKSSSSTGSSPKQTLMIE